MSIKLGDEHVQQQCSNEICLKFIDAPMFFSLTNYVLSGRQSSAIARNNLFSTWTSSQRIQHELCPSLSIVPFQIPKCYFSLSDICDDNQRNPKRFQMSMLFIKANICLLKHTCYFKDYYIRKLCEFKVKDSFGNIYPKTSSRCCKIHCQITILIWQCRSPEFQPENCFCTFHDEYVACRTAETVTYNAEYFKRLQTYRIITLLTKKQFTQPYDFSNYLISL